MRIERIKKRDGREVVFDKHKIVDAVRRAQAAVGLDDAQAALEVADIVEFSLARRVAAEGASTNVPGIEEIQDLVERALIELGAAAVAKSYILYRDRRARVRGALEVEHREAGQRVARAPRVEVHDGLAAWNKGRIVAALVDEANLPRATAERVAARVEERVFASGFKRISTALVRELVDIELVERGLAAAFKKTRAVGLPRNDLRRLFAEEPARGARELHSPSGASERAGAELVRRFALEDVLDEASAERHLAGELWIESLEHAHLDLARSLPAELVWREDQSPFEALTQIGELAPCVAGSLAIDDAAALLRQLQKPARGPGPAPFFAALAGIARAAGRRVDLVVAPLAPRERDALALAGSASWLARAIAAVDALDLEDGALVPRLFVDTGDLVSLRAELSSEHIERALARGTLVPTSSSADARFAGPALVRQAGQRGVLACGALVALNLPRAARRAGPWREDLFFEAAAEQIAAAVEALARLRDFQSGELSARARTRARSSFALAPVGLREALRIVSDGALRAEHVVRAVSFLAEAAQRHGAARGLALCLTPFFAARAAQRFAELDAARESVRQPLLFGDLPSAASLESSYSIGFDLGSREHAGLSAQLVPHACAALAVHALHPASALRSLAAASAAGGDCSFLGALERFEQARLEARGVAHAPYILPTAPARSTLARAPVSALARAAASGRANDPSTDPIR